MICVRLLALCCIVSVGWRNQQTQTNQPTQVGGETRAFIPALLFQPNGAS